MNTLAIHPFALVAACGRVMCRQSREEGGMRRAHKKAVNDATVLVQEKNAAPRDAKTQEHISVMVEEVLGALSPRSSDVILDATAGAGGHAEAMLRMDLKQLIALDADEHAVLNVRARLTPFGARATVINANFGDLARVLTSAHITRIDKALFDLGWNRTQLYDGRGLSFMNDEALNMSYGETPASGATAREIVNEWGEETLADIIFGYSEERYARRIAREIVEARKSRSIDTTTQLVEIITRAVPASYRRGRLHPATKTFQALRIAVNDELGTLDRGVRAAWEMLAPAGRIAVITFHSIEDRAVKRMFAEFAKHGGRLVVKKPLVPGREEVLHNPSARSAKLRIIEKVASG